MAMTDERDTKAMLDRQLEPLQAKLEEGKATQEQMQQALGIAIAHIRIFVRRETVTQAEFDEAIAAVDRKISNHALCCPGAKLFAHPADTLKNEFLKQGFGMVGWIGLVAFLAWKAYGQ